MPRHDATADETARELARIREDEERLRLKKIALLRARLLTLRTQADAVERELRALGDRDATRTAGRIDWSAIFDRLGATFTAREMTEMTGTRPRHVAVITHRWRVEKRIVPTGHGRFRKVSGRR